jgi:hypothetical protein
MERKRQEEEKKMRKQEHRDKLAEESALKAKKME